jgi:hypothetical protein
MLQGWQSDTVIEDLPSKCETDPEFNSSPKKQRNINKNMPIKTSGYKHFWTSTF